MIRPAAALALSLFTLTACPTFHPADSRSADSGPIQVTGTYSHPGSNLEFPEQLGDFRRADIHRTDRDGRGAVVGYNREAPEAVVAFTAYVYRPTLPLDPQFAQERHEIVRYHAGATETGARDVEVTTPDGTLPGKFAEYRYVDSFASAQREVVSLLVLFERNGWLVKYRITYAVSQKPAGERVVASFLKSTPWGACTVNKSRSTP